MWDNALCTAKFHLTKHNNATVLFTYLRKQLKPPQHKSYVELAHNQYRRADRVDERVQTTGLPIVQEELHITSSRIVLWLRLSIMIK